MSGLPPSESGVRAMLPAFLREVRAAKGVLIGTHVNPDGDAIGAALAVSHILDQLGIENEVVCADPPPYYLQFLPGSERISQSPVSKEHSLALVVDLEAQNRLGRAGVHFERCSRSLFIDHHVPVESPGDVRIVDTGSPATCSIILDMVRDTEITVTKEMAECLLTGILTDTGNFRFPNTNAHALHSAGFLLERGADLPRITREIYLQKELPAVMLGAHSLLRMKTECGGRLAWSTVPLELFKELGAEESYTEGIVNELLSVKGVVIAALLREGKPGKIRGSLRSVGAIDVAKVAQQFGGGGHFNAAGVSFDGTLEEAETQVVAALKRCLESS